MTKQTKKLCAFTLAEVLIVLAIIGVVAALTIRTTVVNTRRLITETRLKSTYADLVHAFQLGVQQSGRITSDQTGRQTNGGSGLDIFEIYFKPYLKISKMCGKKEDKYITGTECGYKENENNYIWKKHFYGDDGSDTFKDTNMVSGGDTRRRMFQLYNGAVVLVVPFFCSGEPEKCYNESQIIVDVDGPKGKNLFGSDVFKFEIDYNLNRIVPFHFNQELGKSTTNGINKYGGNAYVCKRDGYDCAAWIAKNGWKIPKDYPAWTGL